MYVYIYIYRSIYTSSTSFDPYFTDTATTYQQEIGWCVDMSGLPLTLIIIVLYIYIYLCGCVASTATRSTPSDPFFPETATTYQEHPVEIYIYMYIYIHIYIYTYLRAAPPPTHSSQTQLLPIRRETCHTHKG